MYLNYYSYITFILIFSQTIYWVLSQRHHFEPPSIESLLAKKSCNFNISGCNCIETDKYRQTECCCKGESVGEFPKNLSVRAKILVIHRTLLEKIEKPIFDDHPYLEEIEIYDLPELTYVAENAISHLKNLRKFSIRRCEKLSEAAGPFLLNNKKIQSLILRNNALKIMPTLKMSESHKFAVEIDLSGNWISIIGDEKVIGVNAKTLRLNNNHIQEISSHAFNGSSFVNLRLDGNKELKTLSQNAFNGIKILHNLNLSNTAIESLPINGLNKVEGLYLENVPTLKKLPSLYNFTDLKVTKLTYPHHCCLLKYVDGIDFNENGAHTKKDKKLYKRVCNMTASKVAPKRKKRSVTNSKPQTYEDFIDSIMGAKQPSDKHQNIPIDDEYDDDLPPFTSDELGVEKCHYVEVIVNPLANVKCTPNITTLNPCENIVGYPLLQKAIWGVWTLAIAGNILVWIVLGLAYEKRMRLHYLYMFNMSIADMCTGVYLSILAIEDYLTADEYYRFAVAWQTGFGCNFAGFLAIFGSFLSIISMFLIAFEMAYNARQAFYGRRLSQATGFGLIVGAWLLALAMASLPLIGVSSYSSTSICLPLRTSNTFDKTFLIFGLFFILTAFVAMVGCYAFIIYMLKENRNSPSREEDKALITKMALLVITDFICWFPTIFFGLSAAFGMPILSLSESKIFLVFFFPINCVSNPFLYVFFTKIIQHNLKAKTIPVLKRFTSPSFTNPLSAFYNNQPFDNRRDSQQHFTLAVTRTTSLNSTPRGSNCSSVRSRSSFESNRRGSSPRVSFQDEQQIPLTCSPSSSPMRRPFSSSIKRVSVVPEVSDVSEHSSESHHEHVPRQKKKMRFSLHRFASKSPKPEERQPEEIALQPQPKSSGQDSGRGSLASSVDIYTSQEHRASIAMPSSSQSRHDSHRISIDETNPHIIFPPGHPHNHQLNGIIDLTSLHQSVELDQSQLVQHSSPHHEDRLHYENPGELPSSRHSAHSSNDVSIRHHDSLSPEPHAHIHHSAPSHSHHHSHHHSRGRNIPSPLNMNTPTSPIRRNSFLTPPTSIAETPPPRRFSLSFSKNHPHRDSIPLLIISDYGQEQPMETP